MIPATLDLPPLIRPAYQKLLWAGKHASAIEHEIFGYLRRRPYLISAEPQRDPEGYVGICHLREPLPEDIPLMFGDFLGNLRAALDYLAQALVIISGNAPINTGRQRTRFPIHKYPPKGGLTITGGVIQPILTHVKSLQPYNRGKREDPLFILNELVNIDKHRSVHMLLAYERINSLQLRLPGSETVVPSVEEGTVTLEDGAEIAFFPTPLAEDKAEVKVTGLSAGQVVLGEFEVKGRLPDVTGVLHACLDDVLLNVFEPFLGIWPRHSGTSTPEG